jgi:hypothetical protein
VIPLRRILVTIGLMGGTDRLGGSLIAIPLWLALAAIIALAGGCGSSSPSSTSSAASSAATPQATTNASTVNEITTADTDRDNDFGSPDLDPREGALGLGRPAGGPERMAIVTVIERYYRAALAEDGTEACSLLYSSFAESAAEDYGQPGGPEYLRGDKTCQQITSGIFRHYHGQLAAEVPRLAVAHILLKGRQGEVQLSFGRLPERKIPVSREGRNWRVAALLDSELP